MKKKMMSVFAVLICISLITLTGCGSEKTTGEAEAEETAQSAENTENAVQSYPVTVTDSLDYEITLEEMPERIVSLSPANTEIVYALGAQDRLVGRSDYDDYPSEAQEIQSVGAYDAPNTEMIISLMPDLVLSANYMDEDVSAQLEAVGAKVYVVRDTGIDDTEKAIQDIGNLIGCAEEAESLVEDMESKRIEIVEKCASVDKQKKVAIDLGSFYSAGPGSLLDSMLSDLNCINIAAEKDSEWPQLSVEEIVAADPDVYISFYDDVDTVTKNPGFDTVSAVKNDEVYFFDALSDEASMMQRSGPRLIEGLEIMARTIYPEVFE